jgi:glycosyltransferase involved in cell wall biosynthesis
MTAIVAATPQIATRFPQEKCTLVQNFPALEELGGINTADYVNRPPLVVYVGSLAAERGLMEMLAAFRRLPQRDAELEIAGAFPDAVTERQARSVAPNNVRLLGPQDRSNVRSLLARSRAGLALLHPITAYKDAQPLKLFEYMAAGLPVIASDFPYWRSMLEPHNCALFVDPLAPAQIAEAVQWVIANPQVAHEMGARGRRAVYEKYNWSPERDRLLGLYAQLANRGRVRAT